MLTTWLCDIRTSRKKWNIGRRVERQFRCRRPGAKHAQMCIMHGMLPDVSHLMLPEIERILPLWLFPKWEERKLTWFALNDIQTSAGDLVVPESLDQCICVNHTAS